jgi:hypothetical protein
VLGERDRQGLALFDVVADLLDGLAQLVVLGLLREDPERSDEREPGPDHRRELAREDRQVLELDLAAQPGILMSAFMPLVLTSVIFTGA